MTDGVTAILWFGGSVMWLLNFAMYGRSRKALAASGVYACSGALILAMAYS